MEKQQRCERCSCLPPRDPCGSPPASQRVQPRGICCSPTSSSPHNSSPLLPAQNRGKPRWNPAAGLCYGVCTTAQGASCREVHRGPQLRLAASHEGGTYFNLSYLLPPHWASDFAPSISRISLSSSPPEKPCLAVAKAETTLPGLLFIGGCPTLCAFLQPRFGPGEKSIAQELMWVRYEAGCCRASETCQHAAAPVSTSPSTSSGVL